MSRRLGTVALALLGLVLTAQSAAAQCTTNAECNDSNQCTTDSCDTGTGVCTNAPVTNGTTCNDQSACTNNDVCTGGTCGGTPIVCFDAKPCTDDTCVPATGCVFTNDNTNSCADANACNGVETCSGGVCQPASPPNCDDSNICTTDSCSPSIGCVHSNNSVLCDDQNNCTVGDGCVGGVCTGVPRNCNDNNVCTTDTCNAAFGCVNAPNNNPCGDGNACNGAETCSGGSCQPGTPLTCNDGNPCTDDTCNTASGCVFSNDNSNSCNDGNVCNGSETCVSGTCVSGSQLTCNDNNPCTDDSCNPATGCVFTNDNTNVCSDANACNGQEVCQTGTCQPGTTLACNDNNPCTDDSCAPMTGCVHSIDDANSCDDGNVCNGAETCAAGTCQAGSGLTCADGNPCTDDSCDQVAGCVFTNDDTNACADASLCNGTESCAGGSCRAGTPPDCDDENPCTDDSCAPATGCIHENADTNSCDDGNVCNGLETCAAGVCRGGDALACDDSNPCSDDSCDPVAGCIFVNDDTNACGDGNACNGVETCLAGGCKPASAPVCHDSNPCTDDACDPSSGCVYVNDDSNSCADGNACNGSEMCVTGTCQSVAPLTCNDGNSCTDDSCNPASGCVYTNDDSNACGDGNACNGVEACAGGTCRLGTPLACNDGNPCTDDSCDAIGGCVFVNDNTNACGDGDFCNGAESCVAGACQGSPPLTCNDSNPCTDDSCNPATGCVFTADNTNSCSDGNVCNGMERCQAGVCHAGLVPVCNDGNPCTDDGCDPVLGCIGVADNTNTCGDANLCNGTEFCQGGTCRTGTPLVCNDAKPCTDDSCNPSTGCIYTNDDTNLCGDGSACNGADTCVAGVCQTAPAPNCNDNNPCTDDSCNPAVGCVHTNSDGKSCDDGSVCTGTELCVNGSCQIGTPLVCNDGNPCTDDACHPVSGCTFATDNTNPCSDGSICTSNDFCSAGVCVSGPPTNCNDNNPCTDDSCDEVFGCRNVADNSNICADANACNGQELCQSGSCRPGATLNCNDNNPCTDDSCDTALGCRNLIDNTNSCGDATVCNGIEVCVGGTCQNGTALNCNDGNGCTNDSCDPVSGCVNTNNQSACDDGLWCTLTDVCTGGQCIGGGERCGTLLCDEQNDRCGECISGAQCDDGNVCTIDRCNLGACQHLSNTQPCDDANFCTTTDVCFGGSCVGQGDACPGQICDPGGRCVDCLDDAHCDDGVFCNGVETCDVVAGTCIPGTPVNCAAQSPEKPHCDEARATCAECLTEAHCTDGLFCTGRETCNTATGTCSVEPPVNCPALNPAKPICDEVTDACVACTQASHCNDANPCTSDACVANACSNSFNSLPCDDGLFCTAIDVCASGACVGSGDACPGETCHEDLNRCGNCTSHADCDDHNQCTRDICLGFACQHSAVVGPCDDGHFCTLTDRCVGETCFGTGDRCPGLVCHEETDQCLDCAADEDCDDGNECTGDHCVNTVCTHQPVSGLCNDGNWCTLSDECSASVCLGSGERCPGQACDPLNLICGGCFTDEHCDDGNPCTVDVCLKETCHNGNAPGSCDDGLFCTRGDTCVDGACIGGADPCEGLADCDEASDSCGGCFPAMVTAVGSRYLAVSPVNPDAYPMAIRVEGDGMDAKVSCVDLYVQAFCLGGPDDGALCGSDADCRRACAGGPVPGLPCTGNYQCAPSGRCEGRCDKGRLGPDPVFMPASKWGMILVGDAELAPDSLYWVTTVCDWGGGPFQSDPAGAITWRRGDVDGNGEVSAVDIAHIVDVIAQRIHGDVTVAGANVWDCLLDNSVNALDIVEAVNTLRSAPSLCPSPCE